MKLNDFYYEIYKNKLECDNLIFNFSELKKKYKTKPSIKLSVNDDFELQLLLPNSFHKKHGTELANVLKSVYETRCYIMWKFDRDIYGYTKNLLSVSYHVLNHGLFLFLNPEINYLKE